MSSQLSTSFPADGVDIVKATMRQQWEIAAAEIGHGGFFMPTGGSAQERTASDKAKDVPSVRDWNAKGDFDTDDTTAIQNALNDAETMTPTGGAIVFPAGIYLTSAPLVLPPRVHIRSNSFGAVIFLAANSDCPMLISTDPTAELQQIQQMAFHGNGANQNGQFPVIDLQHGTPQQIEAASVVGSDMANLIMDRVFIGHASGDAIRISGAGGGVIGNLMMYDIGGNGMVLSAGRFGIDSARVNRCGRNGFVSDGPYNRFTTSLVRACGIDDPNSEGYAWQLNGRCNQLAACEARETNGTAILVDQNGEEGGRIHCLVNAAGRLQDIIPTADAPYHAHITGIDLVDATAMLISAAVSDRTNGAANMDSSIRQNGADGCFISCTTQDSVLAGNLATNGREGTGTACGWIFTRENAAPSSNL